MYTLREYLILGSNGRGRHMSTQYINDMNLLLANIRECIRTSKQYDMVEHILSNNDVRYAKPCHKCKEYTYLSFEWDHAYEEDEVQLYFVCERCKIMWDLPLDINGISEVLRLWNNDLLYPDNYAI